MFWFVNRTDKIRVSDKKSQPVARSSRVIDDRYHVSNRRTQNTENGVKILQLQISFRRTIGFKRPHTLWMYHFIIETNHHVASWISRSLLRWNASRFYDMVGKKLKFFHQNMPIKTIVLWIMERKRSYAAGQLCAIMTVSSPVTTNYSLCVCIFQTKALCKQPHADGDWSFWLEFEIIFMENCNLIVLEAWKIKQEILI